MFIFGFITLTSNISNKKIQPKCKIKRIIMRQTKFERFAGLFFIYLFNYHCIYMNESHIAYPNSLPPFLCLKGGCFFFLFLFTVNFDVLLHRHV